MSQTKRKLMAEDRIKEHTLKAVPKSSTPIIAASEAIESDECQKCFGTGFEVVAGKGAKRCECQKKLARSGQTNRSRLPRLYEECHLHNFKADTVKQRKALKLATQFASEFPAVEQGLLFTGPVGTGKTHLAVSILKGLTERGFNCLFYEFGKLLKEIQDSYNPTTFTSELSVLNPVLKTEVLVLDELGASKPTDWVRDTLYHIINTRYNEKKFTIFTTNYSDERTDPRREILEDRIGIATRSRLYQMCQTVDLDGPDYRRSFDRAVK